MAKFTIGTAPAFSKKELVSLSIEYVIITTYGELNTICDFEKITRDQIALSEVSIPKICPILPVSKSILLLLLLLLLYRIVIKQLDLISQGNILCIRLSHLDILLSAKNLFLGKSILDKGVLTKEIEP